MVNENEEMPEGVVCPVGPLEGGLPFDYAEIEPLLAFLQSNRSAEEAVAFQRGTVTAGQTLDCCKQALGPAGARLLTQALRGNDKIKAILLGTGSIANEGAASVAELLRENSAIETVYLGCNLIDGQGMQVLADSLAHNPQVHALWLKRNPLGVAGAQTLADLLRKNRNLRTLDLVNTLVGGSGLAALVEVLVQEEYPLERLYLSGNYLDEGDAVELAKLLRGNDHLQELYLSVNRLGDAAMPSLAAALAENKQLRILTLASNGISPTGFAQLLPALTSHSSLQSLDLGYARSTRALGGGTNHIGEEGLPHLLDLIRQNRSLLHLDIRKTSISRRGLMQVADALDANDRLQELTHDNIRMPWLKLKIRQKLAQNRAGKPQLQPAADVLAIKSVYR